MGKRILGIIVAIAVGYLIYLGYGRYRDLHDESGEIHGDVPAASSSNDGGDSDSTPVARPKPAAVPTVQQPVAQNAAPAADSIAPNAVNGMAYAGSGKFQVYRQGNLTWRLDTESGISCILFATMEEWKKPIVYSNGCNKS